MAEEIELVEQLIETVKRLKHDQEVQIRHLADLQLNFEEAGMKVFSGKMTTLFSSTAGTR